MSWRDEVRVLETGAVGEEARALGPVGGYLHLVRGVPGRPKSRPRDHLFAQESLSLPDHLGACLEQLVRRAEAGQGPWPTEGMFDAIPFHDVAYAVLLPLSGLAPARALRLFGVQGPGGGARLDAPGRRALVAQLLAHPRLGLTLVDRVALVKNDPFLGRPLGTSLNVMLDVLASIAMASPTALRNELGAVGDVQELFVRYCRRRRSDPPLSAREVLLSLRELRGLSVGRKREVLRSLLERAGKLETFFLIGFLRQGSRLSQTLGDDALIDALAATCQVEPARLDVARSLVDVFELARILEQEGATGLHKLALRPLAPVAPMLAGPEVPAEYAFPAFFEKKYDGVRLMIHKSAGEGGRVRAAAFTRRRLEWTEQIPGLLPLVHALPCREAIVDGELHAHRWSEAGPRPATVYDILKAVRGELDGPPLRLRFAAFDLLYLDGRDLTDRPFLDRRAALEPLVRPLTAWPLPLPVELSDGELVRDKPHMLRLYQLFRAQGYEGGIAKDPHGLYELGKRSEGWTKLKPAITLDLAVTGALYTTSADAPAASFGTYLISALGPGPSLREVGRVQGLGALDSARLVQAILDEGLFTGRTLERQTSSGLKAGVELRPGIVATVRFEGVVRDENDQLSLRDPKIVRVRTDEKDLSEIDQVKSIEELYLKSRHQ